MALNMLEGRKGNTWVLRRTGNHLGIDYLMQHMKFGYEIQAPLVVDCGL